MTRHATPNRNAKHRSHHAHAFAAASTDEERLAAAFAWFRSAARLQGKRRPPEGIAEAVHQDTAARLTRETTQHLRDLAEAIDRGDYDAGKK